MPLHAHTTKTALDRRSGSAYPWAHDPEAHVCMCPAEVQLAKAEPPPQKHLSPHCELGFGSPLGL